MDIFYILGFHSLFGKEDACFVCIILSHGHRSIVLDRDCKYVPIEDLVGAACDNNQPTSAMIPKIFLIQVLTLDSGMINNQDQPEFKGHCYYTTDAAVLVEYRVVG